MIQGPINISNSTESFKIVLSRHSEQIHHFIQRFIEVNMAYEHKELGAQAIEMLELLL